MSRRTVKYRQFRRGTVQDTAQAIIANHERGRQMAGHRTVDGVKVHFSENIGDAKALRIAGILHRR